jgi:hypothetical protein
MKTLMTVQFVSQSSRLVKTGPMKYLIQDRTRRAPWETQYQFDDYTAATAFFTARAADLLLSSCLSSDVKTLVGRDYRAHRAAYYSYRGAA